jgi:hypothetical protein
MKTNTSSLLIYANGWMIISFTNTGHDGIRLVLRSSFEKVY